MTRTGLRLALVSVLAWLGCFFVLERRATWTPFAFVGLLLAALSLVLNAVPRSLLRPSRSRVALGLLCGTAMVVLTHLAFTAVTALVPAVRGATRELLALLNVVGFSAGDRAGLIVVIATCEEVLFRGPLPSAYRARGDAPLRWLNRGESARALAFAAVYALTTAPLGSPLLILCAFVCGSAWGVMRLASGSLVVPVLAHAIWDLGVLIVWPLAA